jgi:2-aminoadipate transaminase
MLRGVSHEASRGKLVPPREHALIELAGAQPAAELLPTAAMNRALAELTAAANEHERARWPGATVQLRKWVAGNLAARGVAIDPERVIITMGAQHAIAMCAAMLPIGARVAVGPETYPGALDVLATAGARAVATAGHVDADYVVDGVAEPYGTDRVAARRAELLASSHMLIVDEAYAELRFDGRLPRPLLLDAPDRVWHIGTISNTLSPALQIGWLIPPAQHYEAVLASGPARRLQTGAFAHAALLRLLVDIDVADVIERARARYAVRAERLVEALRRQVTGVRFQVPEGGFSIWIDTDEAGDDAALAAEARALGVTIDPGHQFRPGGGGDPVAFRISFSHAPIGALDEGARRLAAALQTWRRRVRTRRAA